MGKEKDLGIDGIYVVHALKGYEYHESRLKDVFGEYGFDFSFVTDGDPTLWSDDVISAYFSSDIKAILSGGVLSCTLNHIYCYEKMIRNNDRFALVFENDPFFLGNFSEEIVPIVKEAEKLKEGFIISLEITTFKFPPRKDVQKNKLVYPANYGRCAGAYLIDQTAARNILADLKTNKCSQVIDWWHNTLIDNNVVKMYWAHPPIVEQGSHNGKMHSTISSKTKGLGRKIKWEIQKFYKMRVLYYLRG